jgi:copper homeostasis protein
LLLEICCFNLESALIAQRAGAHRIELCADAAAGGTTQSFGVIKTVKERISLPLYPIIRPRGGDFFFNDEEFEVMMNDVLLCKQIGCDGIVTGVMHQNGTIDKKRCARLAQLAYPMGVTIHRVFDWVENALQALEDVINMGCERILTSGLKPTAMEGAELIRELILQANNRIIIMPGSGIRSSNIMKIADKTMAEEYHSSARTLLKSNMNYINEGMNEILQTTIPDENEIKMMIEYLSEHKTSESLRFSGEFEHKSIV